MNIVGNNRQDAITMDAARREYQVIRAIYYGIDRRADLEAMLGIPGGSLQRTLDALESDGIIIRQQLDCHRIRFELVP